VSPLSEINEIHSQPVKVLDYRPNYSVKQSGDVYMKAMKDGDN